MSKRKTFRELVKEEAPDNLKTVYLEEAADFIEIKNEENPDFTTKKRFFAAEALELARFMQSASERDNGKSEVKPSPQEKTINSAPDLIKSGQLTDLVTPWVEQIRLKLFNQNEPPFAGDMSTAREWLEQFAHTERKKTFTSDREEAKKKIRELSIENSISISFITPCIAFPDEGGSSCWFPASPGLSTYLANEVKSISAATGFNEHKVTAFILTGMQPVLPRAKTTISVAFSKIPNAGTLHRKKVTIEINMTDLPFSELRSIYNTYRKELNIQNTKPLNKSQYKLYKLIKDKGGPPSTGVTAFWQKVQEEWNNTPGCSPYQTWIGVYKAYERILKKLDGATPYGKE